MKAGVEKFIWVIVALLLKSFAGIKFGNYSKIKVQVTQMPYLKGWTRKIGFLKNISLFEKYRNRNKVDLIIFEDKCLLFLKESYLINVWKKIT